VQKFGHNPAVSQMRLDDFCDAVMIEMTIPDWSWPNRHVGTVIAPPLAAAGADLAGGGELMVFECLHEGRSQ
jgi:hypothetical protein